MNAEHDSPTKRLTSADRLAIGVGFLALLAGVLVLSLGSGAVAAAIGFFLIGVCAVAFIALLFLVIGESEDRDRGAL